jgi:hypothetical protein
MYSSQTEIEKTYYNRIVNKTNEKITFHVFDPDYPITYFCVCEWLKNGRLNATFKKITFPWFDKFSAYKRAIDNTGWEEWFIFFYSGRKEIWGVAEKVLDKDNPERYGTYKYFLVMY